MKILMASESYKHQVNGVAHMLIALVNNLRRQGHSVKVIALSDSRTSYQDGDDYYLASFPAGIYPKLRLSFDFHNPFLREIVEWGPDVVHAQTEFSTSYVARRIALECGVPFLMTSHTDYAAYLFGPFKRSLPVRLASYQWAREKFRKTSAVVIPSEKLRDVPHLYPLRDKLHVVPNGIRLNEYDRDVSGEEKAEIRKRYRFPDTSSILLYVARLSKEKDTLGLIKSFQALLKEKPDVRFLIVGDGPDRMRLETYCEENALSDYVAFSGMIPREEVYRYYAVGTMFVCASKFEIHSLSFLEAMAASLPMVCIEDPALAGVVENGVNGFTYRDTEGFVSAVKRLLDDDKLYQDMRMQARTMVERFSDDACMNQMLELYESLCNARKKVR